jgi:hypothetical protein
MVERHQYCHTYGIPISPRGESSSPAVPSAHGWLGFLVIRVEYPSSSCDNPSKTGAQFFTQPVSYPSLTLPARGGVLAREAD